VRSLREPGMTAEFEWGSVLLACALLGLMFVVPTVVLVRDVRRKDREQQEREQHEWLDEEVFSGSRRDRSADGE
jgi:hypothetical protein